MGMCFKIGGIIKTKTKTKTRNFLQRSYYKSLFLFFFLTWYLIHLFYLKTYGKRAKWVIIKRWWFFNRSDWGRTYCIVSKIITYRKVLYTKTLHLAIFCHCFGFYFVRLLVCVLAFVLFFLAFRKCSKMLHFCDFPRYLLLALAFLNWVSHRQPSLIQPLHACRAFP